MELTINITTVRSDWYIATIVMNGKITQGFGNSKVDAIEDLALTFNK